jgi:hypothetical protein
MAVESFYDLLSQMRSGRSPSLPREFQAWDGGSHRLLEPLSEVPAGPVVSIRIVVPDNRGAKWHGLVWRAGKSLTVEQARRALRDELLLTFVNLVMPIGESAD